MSKMARSGSPVNSHRKESDIESLARQGAATGSCLTYMHDTPLEAPLGGVAQALSGGGIRSGQGVGQRS